MALRCKLFRLSFLPIPKYQRPLSFMINVCLPLYRKICKFFFISNLRIRRFNIDCAVIFNFCLMAYLVNATHDFIARYFNTYHLNAHTLRRLFKSNIVIAFLNIGINALFPVHWNRKIISYVVAPFYLRNARTDFPLQKRPYYFSHVIAAKVYFSG